MGVFDLFFKPTPFSILSLGFFENFSPLYVHWRNHTTTFKVTFLCFPFYHTRCPGCVALIGSMPKEIMFHFIGSRKNSFLRLFTLHLAKAVYC